MFLTDGEVEDVLVTSSRRSWDDTMRILADFMPQGTYEKILSTYAQAQLPYLPIDTNPIGSQAMIEAMTTSFAVGFDAGWALAMKAAGR